MKLEQPYFDPTAVDNHPTHEEKPWPHYSGTLATAKNRSTADTDAAIEAKSGGAAIQGELFTQRPWNDYPPHNVDPLRMERVQNALRDTLGPDQFEKTTTTAMRQIAKTTVPVEHLTGLRGVTQERMRPGIAGTYDHTRGSIAYGGAVPSEHTVAHEIGHHVDQKMHIGQHVQDIGDGLWARVGYPIGRNFLGGDESGDMPYSSPMQIGRAEGFADQYAQTHVRNDKDTPGYFPKSFNGVGAGAYARQRVTMGATPDTVHPAWEKEAGWAQSDLENESRFSKDQFSHQLKLPGMENT